MEDGIRSERAVWDNSWRKTETLTISRLDHRIFDQMGKTISFKEKEVIELGCGRGVLGYLALKNGAKKVTLVDFSGQALQIARSVLKNCDNVEFIQSDFLDLEENKRYDIVFSSGVAEHFSGKMREKCIQKHLNLSNCLVAIIVPVKPHYNSIRARRSDSRKQFGWWEPFSKLELKNLIERNGTFKILSTRRFETLYGISLFELLRLESEVPIFKLWNQIIFFVSNALSRLKIYGFLKILCLAIDTYFGGLLITIAQK